MQAGKVIFTAVVTSVLVSLAVFFGLKSLLAARVEPVKVPTVEGMTVGQARQLLHAADLRLSIFERRHHAKTPPGQVIQQIPLAGSDLPPRHAVHLAVSSGKAAAPTTTAGAPTAAAPPPAAPAAKPTGAASKPVPALAGMTVQRAAASLAALGFTITEKQEAHDTVKKGLVIGSKPAAGKPLPAGSPVMLIVSSGPEGDAAVPRVLYRTLGRARRLIRKAGFAVGRVRYKSDEDRRDGIVLRQRPRPGKRAALGSKIDLVVNETE